MNYWAGFALASIGYGVLMVCVSLQAGLAVGAIFLGYWLMGLFE